MNTALLAILLATPAALATEPVKKILCLHGGGQSGSGFSNDAGMTALQNSLGSGYEFVFPSGPYSGGLWIADPPGGKDTPTTDPDWAEDSINLLDEYVQEQGPFFGILGYSQGSAFAPVYLSKVAAGTFQVALLFCGYLPTTHLGLLGLINDEAPFGDIPALVWAGSNDWIISNDLTEEQADVFTSPTYITSSGGSHAVPTSSDSTFSSVVSFITSHAADMTTTTPDEDEDESEDEDEESDEEEEDESEEEEEEEEDASPPPPPPSAECTLTDKKQKKCAKKYAKKNKCSKSCKAGGSNQACCITTSTDGCTLTGKKAAKCAKSASSDSSDSWSKKAKSGKKSYGGTKCSKSCKKANCC